MRKIILASMSPRRKEILAKTHLPFDVVASDYEENMSLALPPSELAEHLSKGKAEAVATQYPRETRSATIFVSRYGVTCFLW